MKTLVALCGAGILTASSVFGSLTVVMTPGPAGGANDGGLFTATTSANGTFNSFCLSISTKFNYNHQYYYDFSSTIVGNGIPPIRSDIAWGTAYIYEQFRMGNATYGGTFNNQAADDAQAAIWFLQGDLYTIYNSSHTTLLHAYDVSTRADLVNSVTTILNDIQTDTGKSWAQQLLNGNGSFGVVAMNMFTDPSLAAKYAAQPQLAIVPEPMTMIAGALLLLPFGASTIRILRKNRSA